MNPVELAELLSMTKPLSAAASAIRPYGGRSEKGYCGTPPPCWRTHRKLNDAARVKPNAAAEKDTETDVVGLLRIVAGVPIVSLILCGLLYLVLGATLTEEASA